MVNIKKTTLGRFFFFANPLACPLGSSGFAAAWNKKFVEEHPNLENLNLGTWDDFKKNLEEAFSPYDMPGEARENSKDYRKKGKHP